MTIGEGYWDWKIGDFNENHTYPHHVGRFWNTLTIFSLYLIPGFRGWSRVGKFQAFYPCAFPQEQLNFFSDKNLHA
jgi:hypothetical protein